MHILFTLKFDVNLINNKHASMETIRIFHECEVRIENSGSLFGIMRLC